MNYALALQLTCASGTLTSALAATGDNIVELNLTVAPAAAEAETDLVITEATLQGFYIAASAAMTVHFNSVAGGYNAGNNIASFTLVANVPQFWFAGNGANPFTGNAAAVYVVSTPGGTLQIRALMNT